MGTSFADQAWDRESAVYRVTGVLTVIGGWFLTALIAFSTAFLFVLTIHYLQATGIAALLILAGSLLYRTHFTHQRRVKDSEQQAIFNLKKIDNPQSSVATTYEHTSVLLGTIRSALDDVLEGLFNEDLALLRKQRKLSKKIQLWTNVVAANVFKVLRLLNQKDMQTHKQYPQAINCLQSIADIYRDLSMRTYSHISHNHKGLLPEQIEDLRELKAKIQSILLCVESTLRAKTAPDLDGLRTLDSELRLMTDELSENQVARIRDRSSKTRLSILFYAITGDIRLLSRRCVKLAELLEVSLRH
jgi:Na+/phosphate symporter